MAPLLNLGLWGRLVRLVMPVLAGLMAAVVGLRLMWLWLRRTWPWLKLLGIPGLQW